MAWADAVTVIRDNWWLNCKIDGKGALLYDLNAEEPFKTNLAAENMELAKDMLYGQLGWDKATGMPTRATLERLDLEYVADDLAGRGLLP